MSNNKFHFEFKKRIPKLYDFFFPFHVQKRNYSYYFYLKFIIFICLKKKILDYTRGKLLTFIQKNRSACSEAITIYKRILLFELNL